LTGGWNGRPSVQEEMDSNQSQRVARRLFHQLIFIQQIRKLFHFIRKKMINEFWVDYRVGTAGSWREFVNCSVPKNSEFQK
jgi:hypothetical protein